MDLWIRSQNKKELIKSNRIYQYAGAIYGEAKEDIALGTYKSRERALEVLDEIQKKLMDFKVEFNDSGVTYKDVSVLVYEMPKV